LHFAGTVINGSPRVVVGDAVADQECLRFSLVFKLRGAPTYQWIARATGRYSARSANSTRYPSSGRTEPIALA
jgi:hypothetical protein